MKRKFIIFIGALAILGFMGYCGTNYCRSKQLELRNDAIENIENGNYQTAVDELSGNSSDSEDEKLLKLASRCREMEEAYLSNDYEKTEKILEEIKTMEYLDLVISKVDSINAKTSEKLKDIDNISNLEYKVNALIDNNSFKEAAALIEENKDKIDIEKINENLIAIESKKETLQSKFEDNKPIIDDFKAVKGKLDELKDKIKKKGQVDKNESEGENA